MRRHLLSELQVSYLQIKVLKDTRPNDKAIVFTSGGSKRDTCSEEVTADSAAQRVCEV
jgi:hypothetical protein